MNTCKTCVYFERGKWHKSIDVNESPKLGGKCDLLLEVLKIDNSEIWNMERISIQDTFGCILWNKKRQ